MNRTMPSSLDIGITVICIYAAYKTLDHFIRKIRIGRKSERYILITGCDTGFGNLLAKRLDQLGCHVFAGCLTEKGETELRKVSSNRLHSISLDVTKKESVQGVLDFVQSKLPHGKGLWGVVNNAGCIYKSGPNAWLSVDDFKRQCEVNLWGLIDVSLTFLPLVKKEKGRIINMSSAAGRSSIPLATTYSVSKYGVEAFTDGLRRDLRLFGCKAILIEPGGFKTPGASVEAFSRSFSEAWADAPDEAKEEYGEEFADYLRTVLAKKISEGTSERVDKVVSAYEGALLSRFPRIRYVVGMDIACFYLPLNALPEWMSDSIWSLFQKSAPLPAALRRKIP